MVDEKSDSTDSFVATLDAHHTQTMEWASGDMHACMHVCMLVC